MIGLFDWLKLGVGAVVGLALGYQVGHWRGHVAGYEKLVAQTAAQAVKAEAVRRGDDAKLQSMSDYDLCVAGLGRERMHACDVLRGLDAE